MKKPYLAMVLGTAAACVVAVVAARPQSALAQAESRQAAPGLMGTIQGPDGKPMNGVTVSLRATDQFMTTSVYTDDRGVYVFPHLAAGTYKLWAQAVGFLTEKAQVTLDGTRTTKKDLSMKTLADFEMQLTGYEWFSSLPDDSADHKRVKQILYVACTGCHSLDLVLQNRFDEAGWSAIVRSMETGTYNGWKGKYDAPEAELGWQGQIMRHHRADLAKYLAEVRGPNSPALNLKPLPRPTGDAARAVVTEYDLPINARLNVPAPYTGGDWMLGPSTGMHSMVGVHDVVVDPAGIAWITQSRTTFETNRTLVRLDTNTGEMKAIALHDANGDPMFFEQVSSAPDPSGKFWMHTSDAVASLDPATGTFAFFPQPRSMGGMANSTDTDSKGRVFINGRYGITVLDPAEVNRTDVANPGWHLYQQLTPGNGTTYGISVDSEGNPWWSESYADKVARRDMKTGKTIEIDMYDPEYEARKALATPADLAYYDSIGAETWAANSAEPLPYASMPRRLAADKNGNSVWVPNWAQSNLAEIDIRTLKVTYHKLPIQVHPYKTIVDKQHNVYTDTSLADSVFKYSPATQAWTQYRLPSHGCGSRHVSFDDFKGDLWLPCDQSDKVARFQFRSAEQIRTLEAAAR